MRIYPVPLFIIQLGFFPAFVHGFRLPALVSHYQERWALRGNATDVRKEYFPFLEMFYFYL